MPKSKKHKKGEDDLPASTEISVRCMLEEHDGNEHRFSLRDEIKNVVVE